MASKSILIDTETGLTITTARALTSTAVASPSFQQGSFGRATFIVENLATLSSTTWTITIEWKSPGGNTLVLGTASLANTASGAFVPITYSTAVFNQAGIQTFPIPNQVTSTATSGTDPLTMKLWAWVSPV